MEKAIEFGSKYDVSDCFNDISQMCKNVDVVYIASPNGLHYKQSKECLLNGVHVICEKPSMTSLAQLEEVEAIARDNNLFFLEAVRTIYTKKYQFLKEQISKIGRVRYSYFQYMKVSSKYPAYKNGTVLTAFSNEMSGGSNYDLGVYLAYLTLYLFGEPVDTLYKPVKLSNGIDGLGTMIFNYDDHIVVTSSSKVSATHLMNEVQGEDGTIVFDDISDPTYIKVINDKVLEFKFDADIDLMIDEVNVFVEAIKNNNQNFFEDSIKKSKNVLEILERSRRQNSIIFPEL
jgi:predicted dehydrogenase